MYIYHLLLRASFHCSSYCTTGVESSGGAQLTATLLYIHINIYIRVYISHLLLRASFHCSSYCTTGVESSGGAQLTATRPLEMGCASGREGARSSVREGVVGSERGPHGPHSSEAGASSCGAGLGLTLNPIDMSTHRSLSLSLSIYIYIHIYIYIAPWSLLVGRRRFGRIVL